MGRSSVSLRATGFYYLWFYEEKDVNNLMVEIRETYLGLTTAIVFMSLAFIEPKNHLS